MDNSKEMREQIAKIFNFHLLPEDQIDSMVDQVLQLLFQGILLRSATLLSEEQQDAFAEKIEAEPDNPDAAFGYLRQVLPNFDALVTEEVLKLKVQTDSVTQSVVDVANASE